MSEQQPNTAAFLQDWFLGERDAKPDQVRAAADELSSDPEGQAAFDALAMADRLLGEHPDEPGEFERDFGRALFAANLDALLAQEQSDQAEEPARAEVIPLRRARQPVAAWVSAAAVLLLGVFTVTQQASQTDPYIAPEFQARTASVAGWKPRPDAPKLMAFCVERSDGEVVFTGPEQAPFGVVSCPANAELKLAVQNSQRAWKWAAFFGVHEDGTLMWYGPSPAAPTPIEVGVSDEIQPVGETIRLGVNHKDGAVRIHALFANEPVDFDQVERWASTQGPLLFDNAMVVEPDVGTTDTQLFEVTP